LGRISGTFGYVDRWGNRGKIGGDSPERIQYHGEEHELSQQRHHQRCGRNDFRQEQEEHSERQQNGYA